MANPNFTLKCDLRDANLIRAAVKAKLEQLGQTARSRGTDHEAPVQERQAAGAEVMEYERILRIHF